MSNGNGHHWTKFNWRDWKNNTGLRTCSIGARGFWVELLGMMHEATPVGYLMVGKKPATIRQIAVGTNVSEREASKLLAELEEAEVFSRTPDGTIYSERMVKAAALSESGRGAAEKRWNDHKPNGSPNGIPIRKPNGVGNAEPNGEPISLPPTPPFPSESESESEREPPYPHDVGEGTPQAGTPPLSRSFGKNRRETGENPRARGTNPRAGRAVDKSLPGVMQVIINEKMEAQRQQEEREKHEDRDARDRYEMTTYMAPIRRLADGAA